MSAAQSAPNSGGGFSLTVVNATGTTSKWVPVDLFTIGRAEGSNLKLTHESVADHHLTVHVEEGQCWILDHGSANGTFVNGVKIAAHVLVQVGPSDKVVAGQSDCTMAFAGDRRRPNLVPPPPPAFKAQNKFAEEAERLLHEAQVKAALILQEAETEAERKVHEIYRQAQVTQARTNELRQQRLNEAYQEAEEIYTKARDESKEILASARKHTSEIREQAEAFVRDLRRRTEQDCETMLQEAQLTARQLKDFHTQEAEKTIRRKEEEIITAAREAMREREVKMLKELEEGMVYKKAEIEQEMVDRITQFELEHKQNLDRAAKLNSEIESLEAKKSDLATMSAETESNLKMQTAKLTELTREFDSAKKSADPLLAKVLAMQNEASRLEATRGQTEARIKETQDTLKALSERMQISAQKAKEAETEAEKVMVALRDKLEGEKTAMQNEEKTYFDNLKLQTARKVADLEKQMLIELGEKSELLARELILKTEAFIKEHPAADSGELEELAGEFGTLIGARATAAKTDDIKTKLLTAAGLQRQQRLVAGFVGILLGGVIALTAEITYRDAQNATPLLDKLAQARLEREQDLERRKFNPAQTPEVRDSYEESVIYTKNYVKHYLDDGYQKNLHKALSPYMFKTWRIEEEKIVQLLAISTALVKNLEEKRAAIHPDFIPQGLAKMRDLEKETTARMRELLGSNVRFESFRKFENEYYQNNRPQE